MSIDFTILCTRAPGRFLARRARGLRWGGRTGEGSFAGMSLARDELRATDPLPAPDWADRVVAVIRASGHLGDDTFDDFDDWTAALARATHGAVYSHGAGEFIYTWTASGLREGQEPPTSRRFPAFVPDERPPLPPPPTTVDELVEVLAASERGDPLGWPRLEHFLGARHDDVKRRQALVVALARSGRAVAEVQVDALAALVGPLDELTSASGRAAFARHGALAAAIAGLSGARVSSAEQRRRSREQDVARRVAEYDALYGPDRKRPRMPDDLVRRIRRGEVEAVVLAYRERFPAHAKQAERAVEDARAFYGPGAPGNA